MKITLKAQPRGLHTIISFKSSTAFNFFSKQNHINKLATLGFPGGAVVKNPPANAGNMGSSPGPGRSHMLHSN